MFSDFWLPGMWDISSRPDIEPTAQSPYFGMGNPNH